MKKIIFVSILLLCNTLFLYSEDFNLGDGISMNPKNETFRSAIQLKNEIELKSLWGNGVVIRYSDDEKNSTGFGVFIEIEYELGFYFEGVFMSQGKIKVIFSNLKERKVDRNSEIDEGTLIGISKKDKYLSIYLVSDTDNIRALQIWTKNKKNKIDGIWYWDPSFMFN